ncbi:MAG: hypothetical protein KDK70_18400 [Myxococcales bacterium]|nr:hypothetical protein [Myxococcales bacterium]
MTLHTTVPNLARPAVPSGRRPALARAGTIAAALVCTAGLGCQQPNPPGTGSDSSGGTEVPIGEGELGSYFPLVDGGTWTYVITNAAGQLQGTEIVEASVTTFDGAEAFVFVDNPNEQGEWTESTILRAGTSAERVHKEIMIPTGAKTIVDYDPGFTRFDDAWTEEGGKGERRYQRTEQKPMDPASVPDEETRGHVFTVTAVGESVTVAAGTFDCIAVERVRTTGASAGERVLLWYAAGVGKVREERPGEDRVEELSELSIPGGAVLP